jgi:hypothetical protein
VAGSVPPNLPDPGDNPAKPPLVSELDLLWNFDMIPGATFDMEYVDVFYSNAASNPVSIPKGKNVTALPYDNPISPAVAHYCYKWLSNLFAIYSYTEDSDYNGKIDRIRVTTEAAVDDNFSGFVAEVSGYTIKGYSRPSLGNAFFINLEEKPYLDTDATPAWHVVSNTSLVDDQYKTQFVWTLSRAADATGYNSDWMIPGDTAWPILGYTLSIPGLAGSFLHFSEPIVRARGTPNVSLDASDFSGATAFSRLSGTAPATSEALLDLGPLSAATIASGASLTFSTVTAQDIGSAPYWENAYNNLVIGAPAPTYPPSTGYTADPNSYAQYGPSPNAPFSVTLGRPPFEIQGGSGKTSHRVSDLLVSVPPSPLYPDSYFVWPIWAKDQSTVSLSEAEIEALSPAQSAAMGIGLIRAFDGSQWLRDQDITLQARLNSSLAGMATGIDLHFDSRLSETLVSSTGLWLPAFDEANSSAEAGFSGLVPYPDKSPRGRGASSTPGSQTAPASANLWNFDIDSGDPRVVSVSTLGFFFSLGSSAPAGRQPLYGARLDVAAGESIPAAWYRLVKPFAFEIHDIRLQRGSVTVLNNVIDPSKGETARLSYQIATEGAVTITVFTLDGNVVKRLYSGSRAVGDYSTAWDGKNLSGATVSRGVYFIRVVGPGIDEIRKVMVVRRP